MEPVYKTTPEHGTPQSLKTYYIIALTEHAADSLTILAQEASDQLGRTISGSAIVRALVRLAGQATTPWATIVAAVEQEIGTGRKRDKGSPNHLH